MTIYDKGIKLVDDEDAFQQYVVQHPTAFHKVNFDMSIIYELPTASVLAYLVNENGIYQIKDMIFRVTFDHNLELSVDKISKLDQLLLPISEINDSDIKVTKTNIDNALKSGGQYNQFGEYSYKTAYIQSGLRIVARLKTFSYTGGTIIEARTTSQKKGFLGIWSQKEINMLSLSWDQGYVKFYGSTIPTIISAESITYYNVSDCMFVKA